MINDKTKAQIANDERLQENFKNDPEKMMRIAKLSQMLLKSYGKEIELFTALGLREMERMGIDVESKDIIAVIFAITGSAFTEGYSAKEREILEGKQHEA